MVMLSLIIFGIIDYLSLIRDKGIIYMFDAIENPHRRLADHSKDIIENKIISLIEQTDDNKDKAYLLILMKINDSITINTNNTNQLANKLKEMIMSFDRHTKAEEAILNRGRGWRDILVPILGIFQALGLWAMFTLTTQIKNIKIEQAAQKIEIIKQHVTLEKGNINASTFITGKSN